MNYENIMLEKGMYGSSKSFTDILEGLDPSSQYAGTNLSGLDAFERQLKRFDISVKGASSDKQHHRDAEPVPGALARVEPPPRPEGRHGRHARLLLRLFAEKRAQPRRRL